LVVLLAASGGVADAQATGTLPNGATLVFEHRKIFNPSTKAFFEPQAASTDLLRYFNLAHCNCARALGTTDNIGQFIYHVRGMGSSMWHSGVAFWTGTNCDDPAHRTGGATPTCIKIGSAADLEATFYPGGADETFNLYQVVNGTVTGACQQLDNANNSIFA